MKGGKPYTVMMETWTVALTDLCVWALTLPLTGSVFFSKLYFLVCKTEVKTVTALQIYWEG